MNLSVVVCFLILCIVINAEYKIPIPGEECQQNSTWITKILSNISYSSVSIIKDSESNFLTTDIMNVLHQNVPRILQMASSEHEWSFLQEDYQRLHENLIIMITGNIETLKIYFNFHQKIYKMLAKIVVILCSGCEDLDHVERDIGKLFRKLWIKTGALDIVVVLICGDQENIVQGLYTFNPFRNSSRGELINVNINSKEELNVFDDKLGNLDGYPLKISMFPSTMAIPKHVASHTDEYWGLDIDFVETVAKVMNFTFVFVRPEGSDWYGSRLENGTFTGMIGDILHGRTDLSFVGIFVKDYSTEDLDFTPAIAQDRLCFIVEKASRIPGWKIVFKCFTADVWMAMIAFDILLCGVYILMSKTVGRFDKNHVKDKSFRLAWKVSGVLFSVPVIKLPEITSQRIFIVSCLLWSLTFVTGAFQSSLATLYTKPLYNPDIETLGQLKESGKTLIIDAAGLMDIFGIDPSPQSDLAILKSRIKVIGALSDWEEIWSYLQRHKTVAYAQRLVNIQVVQNTYLKPDGTDFIHLIEECPRSYRLAYIFPKFSVYKRRIDTIIHRLTQSGIKEKWVKNTLYKLNLESIKVNRNFVINNQQKLTLNHLQIAFIVLLVGLSFGLLAFLIELFIAHRLPYKHKINVISFK